MDIDEIDVGTDSEFDSDEDVQLETENLERLTEMLDEEDDTLSHSPSHGCTPRPSVKCASPSPQSNKSNALAQIEAALAANKLLDEKTRRLERELDLRLRECRQKLQLIQGTSSTPVDKSEIFRYINCGRPYFKDRLNFPAPDNDDAKMAKSQMYDFSLVISVPGWTVRDKSQFVTMIHKMSIDLKKNELHTKIAALKRKSKSNPTGKAAREITVLRREMDNVCKRSLSQLALPIDKEYDWDMLTNKLNRRHTAQEYQSLWKLFFHPSINKNSWSTTEHNALQKIAADNNQQDWDNVAQKLNTARTGYQCFVYYRTNMTNSFTGKRWTNDEITYLKRLIEYFKEDSYIPWGKIAAAMENRTKIQIYNKYLRLIEQRKGRFLLEEDAVILNCVERFGTNFRRLTDYLPGRSMVQIRARYQVLSKMRVSTVWTVEDDRKLIQIMNNQDSDMSYSTATQYFPGKTRVKIRSRYLTLIKWMKKHPNLDLEHAPRRGARRLNHGLPSNDLNEAIKKLKTTLSEEVEVKAKITKLSSESSINELEDGILAQVINHLIKEQTEIKKNSLETQIDLGDDNVVSYADLNTTNLRKMIIFLNARLNPTAFAKSKYCGRYPNLSDGYHDVSLVKVKSYSRKNTVETLKFEDSPNIWGTPTLGQRNYVTPPHLSNISGCKLIMAHVAAMSIYCESMNLNVLVRRNSVLKQQLEYLLERFYILFTWPLVLSNECPNEVHMKLNRTYSTYVRPPTLPQSPEVTIKLCCMKKFRNVDVAEVIDLKENETNKRKVTVEENLDHNNEKIEKLLID